MRAGRIVFVAIGALIGGAVLAIGALGLALAVIVNTV